MSAAVLEPRGSPNMPKRSGSPAQAGQFLFNLLAHAGERQFRIYSKACVSHF